jgi:hypothetical protein
MNPQTWSILDRQFAEDEQIAGRRISRASEVPTEEEIFAASAAIGCHFHEDYVSFLHRFGAGTVGSLPVFGLRPVDVMGKRWSVVEVTNWFRQQGWLGTADWYIISEDGFGNPMGVAPDGRVMISDHDIGQVSVVAENFEDFLLHHCLKRA